MGWYVHEINVGVSRYAQKAGWILNDSASHCGAVPAAWQGEGIITLSTNLRTPLSAFVNRAKVPVVDVAGEFTDRRFARVQPDNFAIGRVAVEELLGRGFRKFAFFTMDRKAPVVRERIGGFRDAVEKAGCDFHLLDYTAHMRQKGNWDKMIPWLGAELKKLPKPLATMAQYDGEADYLVRASLHAGLRVPEDVAVMGVDNDPIYSEFAMIPLSSVISNRELIGYRAAELLGRLMNGGRAPSEPLRILPGGVVVRRSTDIFASEDPAMSKALAYIAGHCTEPIEVKDIVKASGVCRRTLFIKFSTNLGRSIHLELLRQRIALAKQQLSTSNDKLDIIAANCGFSSLPAFYAAFRSQEGTAPSQFRKV